MKARRLDDLASTARTFGRLIERVALARTFWCARKDGRIMTGPAIDRTNWSTTVIFILPVWRRHRAAYLTLRDRTDGRVSLERLCRPCGRQYGKPERREGYVDHPYTTADASPAVSGTAFARTFFGRYVQGHEGRHMHLRVPGSRCEAHPDAPGSATCVSEFAQGWRVSRLVPPTWRFYATAIDEMTSLQQSTAEDRRRGDYTLLHGHSPGDCRLCSSTAPGRRPPASRLRGSHTDVGWTRLTPKGVPLDGGGPPR